MHLTRCTSLDVLHSDVLHSVYYTLCTMLCTLDSACIVLCVLDPMYFSKGFRTEEPFPMLSGIRNSPKNSIGSYYLGPIGLGPRLVDLPTACRNKAP